MAQTSRIQFIPADEPVTDYVTKFGGQPTWVEGPQWPLSRQTGRPMRFLAQIALEPPAFVGAGGKMAYIFITDEEEYVDGTWEPDGGENAVVIQPGTFDGPTMEAATGPSLYTMAQRPGQLRLVPEPAEFRVELSSGEEPDYQPETVRRTWTDPQFEQYAQALEGNKIGGAPIFLQGDEFPAGGDWKLLLQLDSTAVPFSVNFGDAGIAYAFIDVQERQGKLLWQCG
jgi:uncharacterized protein YwqG